MVLTNAVTICGSLRMEKSNTMKLLKPFLEGMEAAGASVDVFYTKRLNIKPCDGEFYCWNKKPGECYINDSMQTMYPALREADILVFATPVYAPLPGEMQNFLNRLVPLMNPVLKRQNGRTRAKLRPDVKISKFALVSSSGWWEMGNFGTVLRIIKELAKDCNVKFAGALLRPHIHDMEGNPKKAKEILDAAKQAGYQLIKNGSLPKPLLKTISQPLTKQTP